jgi:hypothetical protein
VDRLGHQHLAALDDGHAGALGMIWPIPNFMAWTALAVGLAVGAGVQQIRVNNAKAELAQVREQHAQAVADAALAKAAAHARALEIERALTAKEQALQATIDKQAEDARNAQAQHAADRAAADAAAGRLREQLATIARAASAGARVQADSNSSAARERAAADATARVLAELLQRASDRVGALAVFADAAHGAGLACERAYTSAREALTR